MAGYEAYFDARARHFEKPYPSRGEMPAYPQNIVADLVPHEFESLIPFLWDRVEARKRLLLMSCQQRQRPNQQATHAKMNLDPFTGRPFLMKKDGGEFAYYSAGPDMDDDGGRGLKEEDFRSGIIPDGDIAGPKGSSHSRP
jgi:hypothetical protein